MRRINEIIVHCSATYEGKNYTVKDIDRWHRERGLKLIGYHYVIGLDGSLESGRGVVAVGAHCKGHNAHSIGVCYIGGLDSRGKPKDTRTLTQRAALESLLRYLVLKYPTINTIHGHRFYNKSKACPCFDVEKEFSSDWIRSIAEAGRQ